MLTLQLQCLLEFCVRVTIILDWDCMLQATPTSDTAMFYFQTNRLHFGPEFLGRVRLVAALASLAGVGVFNYFLKPVPLRRIFLWTSLTGTVLGLSQLLLITGELRAHIVAPQQMIKSEFPTQSDMFSYNVTLNPLLMAAVTLSQCDMISYVVSQIL